MQTQPFLARLVFKRLLPLLMLAFAGAAALAQTDPPSRVASLSYLDGSVVFAPAGETEWADAVLNRPVTRGDRLWTDRGAKAELHAGASVLHVDGETFVDVAALDANAFQASVKEGAVSARVRQLAQGENFEIDTPNLAFRATQPGDFRIDVDAQHGTTRVTVRSGTALVYGANGQGQQLRAGQQVTFSGRDLARVAVQAAPAEDGFDRWVAERDRREDQSIAARHVPREVVGYQQLDPYGTWAEDASYGAVWYPQVTVADWAPYRYGHWEWIAPWGWTWIDDAPWGFAPFHYGRWALIGSRWAWVPGRFGPRPVYAPALVTFVGGAGGVSLSLSIGDAGIGWFPLAPGEAWRPSYHTTAYYLGNVNRYVGPYRQGSFAHQQREAAFTAVRVDDFRRGRPVHTQWRSVGPVDLARTQALASSALPTPQRHGDAGHAARSHTLPLPQLSAPAFTAATPGRMQAPGIERHGSAQLRHATPAPRDDARWQQERSHREQQAHQQRVQREQHSQALRHQEEQRRAQHYQAQREHAIRQQQAAQQQVLRQQWQQQRALREQGAPAARQAEGNGRGWQGHGAGRGPVQREENRSQREDDGGRGHGHGRS